MKEGLSSTQKTQNHSQYVFQLKRIDQSQPKVAIRVDFSSDEATMGSDGLRPPQPSIPIFNHDHKYYTPCFILPADQIKFQTNMELCLASHIHKVKQMSQPKNVLFVPKPSESNRFCMVCKQQFNDYLTHIYSSPHRKNLRQSPFQNDIIKLCELRNVHKEWRGGKKIEKERIKMGRNKKGERQKAQMQENVQTGAQVGSNLLMVVG